MTFQLALRNTRLHFVRRLPLALFLAATLTLLFLGNTVFSGTDEGMSKTFKSSLTADLSISADSEDPFTLFGSELPLLGTYFRMPVILNYDSVQSQVAKTLPDASVQPVVVGVAKLSLSKFSSGSALFAADLASYLKFFPSIRLIMGGPPPSGQPALLLNQKVYDKAVKTLGRPIELGEKFLLASAQENSFALREAPLVGVFSYPVYDPVLDNVSLIDVGTGRDLAGYFVTQAAGPEATETAAATDIDDLFADAADTKASTTGGLSFESVTSELAKDGKAPVSDPKTWNFLLIRSAKPERAASSLNKALQSAAAPVQIRDWRDTAGGNAKIVWFIQVIFNLGLVFISLVAGLIVMNSMSLAVAERTKEIGTMRSLGAARAWVARLISWETILLVAGAGAAGVLVGVLIVAGMGLGGGLSITNPFLASLLGTEHYVPQLSPLLVLQHLALSVLLGVLSTILPATKALQISPLQAMARE